MKAETKKQENNLKIENIRVFVRLRPFNVLELSSSIRNVVQIPSENTLTITKPDLSNEKTFTFSKIFTGSSSQVDIYTKVALPIVEQVLKGYNGTIFAYGQSGTGKTYTMIGNPSKEETSGIIPNIFSHIFTEISASDHKLSYLVTVTYLEIYNEEVRDLLSEISNKKLQIRERPDVGVYIKDLLGFSVDSIESVTDLLARGNKNRAVGSTKLNDLSSRSHAIFTIHLESRNKENNETKFGKLNLVDLAGSERIAKSMACGERLKEAGKINLSLSVLGNVISALVDKKKTHIPYRNSKLTRLLQDSLGGNFLTSMIATISPTEIDHDESVCTLMYADRVKHIQNSVSVNTEKNSVLEQFEIKINELQNQLDQLELNQQKNLREKRKLMSKSKTKLFEEDLLNIEYQKRELLKSIGTIQKKILIGGQSLIEKTEYQMYLLENTTKELQKLDSFHQQMEDELYLKGVEIKQTEKKYCSLQEEDLELNKQIEEAEKQLKKQTTVLLKKENEYQNQISQLLYDNKCLAKDLDFVELVIEKCIPMKYIKKIKKNMKWDSEGQEWKIKCVAHTGNNIKRSRRKNLDNNVCWKINQEAFEKY